jgi:hypothetical protein
VLPFRFVLGLRRSRRRAAGINAALAKTVHDVTNLLPFTRLLKHGGGFEKGCEVIGFVDLLVNGLEPLV